MKQKSKNFIPCEKKEWEDLGGGIQRYMLGYDDQIMMVKVKFEKGAVGAPHAHVHSQTTYCESGKFEFTIGGKTDIVNTGDGVYIDPNVQHGAVCLEAGTLIDVFSPMREDFLDGSDDAYKGRNTK